MNLPVVQVESAALPPLYAEWARSLLGGPIPAEINATCDDCAMCDAIAAPNGDGDWFNPAVKCCTYLPELPNFIVGRILLDSDPGTVANRAPLDARLSGSAVHPMGLRIPTAYQTLYKNLGNRFGHSSEMLCPHYVEAGGRCGIWRHRNAVCATWFCKHERGTVGKRFWAALLQWLRSIEKELAIWCVNELQPSDRVLLELFEKRRDGSELHIDTEDGPADIPKDSPLYKTLWGVWFGREREYFTRCAELVSPLEWPRVLELCGQETRVCARSVTAAYRELMDTRIPGSLGLGAIHVLDLDPQRVRLAGYSLIDSVEIPRELFDALDRFDGRPTLQARQAISDDHGLELSDDLIRGLVDFGILKTDDAPAEAQSR